MIKLALLLCLVSQTFCQDIDTGRNEMTSSSATDPLSESAGAAPTSAADKPVVIPEDATSALGDNDPDADLVAVVTKPAPTIPSETAADNTTSITEAQFEGVIIKKFDHFITDMTDCAKSVVNKYDLAEEIQFIAESISEPEFFDVMENGDDDAVRAVVLKAVDPFFEKITGFNHELVVSTMPSEIVNWIQNTFLVYQNITREAEELPEENSKEKTPLPNVTPAPPSIMEYSRLTKEQEKALNAKLKEISEALELKTAQMETLNKKIAEIGEQFKNQNQTIEFLTADLKSAKSTIQKHQEKNINMTKANLKMELDHKLKLEKQKAQIQKEFSKEMKVQQDQFDLEIKEKEKKIKSHNEELDDLKEQCSALVEIAANSTAADVKALPGKKENECDEDVGMWDGRDYRGCQTKTRSGRTCQYWSAQYPHPHSNSRLERPKAGLEKNYCRNPDGASHLWCYTTDILKRWEYCDPMKTIKERLPSNEITISVCDETLEGEGDENYRGCQTKTRLGQTCQSWKSQFPHIHNQTPKRKPYSGLEQNFCRNPDGETTIWCYTTNPRIRFDYCDPVDNDNEFDSSLIDTPNTEEGTLLSLQAQIEHQKQVKLEYEKVIKQQKKQLTLLVEEQAALAKKNKRIQKKYYKSPTKKSSSQSYVSKAYSYLFGGF